MKFTYKNDFPINDNTGEVWEIEVKNRKNKPFTADEIKFIKLQAYRTIDLVLLSFYLRPDKEEDKAKFDEKIKQLRLCIISSLCVNLKIPDGAKHWPPIIIPRGTWENLDFQQLIKILHIQYDKDAADRYMTPLKTLSETVNLARYVMNNWDVRLLNANNGQNINPLQREEPKINFTKCSKILNPLRKNRIKLPPNAVSIWQLDRFEFIVLYYIINRGQDIFTINKERNETDRVFNVEEIFTLSKVVKSLKLAEKAAMRQAVENAFFSLAGKQLAFYVNNTYKIYPVFSKLELTETMKKYKLNDEILRDRELLGELVLFYKSNLTNLNDFRDIFKYKGNLPFLMACIELINELPLYEARKTNKYFTLSNFRSKLLLDDTNQSDTVITQNLRRAFDFLGYKVTKKKDKFIIERIVNNSGNITQ